MQTPFHAFANKQIADFAFWCVMFDSFAVGVAVALLASITYGSTASMFLAVLTVVASAKLVTSLIGYAISVWKNSSEM